MTVPYCEECDEFAPRDEFCSACGCCAECCACGTFSRDELGDDPEEDGDDAT